MDLEIVFVASPLAAAHGVGVHVAQMTGVQTDHYTQWKNAMKNINSTTVKNTPENPENTRERVFTLSLKLTFAINAHS